MIPTRDQTWPTLERTWGSRGTLLIALFSSSCAVETNAPSEDESGSPPRASSLSRGRGDAIADDGPSAPLAALAGACTPGSDLTCNAAARDRWYSGTCLANATCACATGNVLDASGRCERTSNDNFSSGALAADAREDEGAIVSSESVPATAGSRIRLQWLDAFGVLQGAPVELASGSGLGSPTVATDGARYVACWSQASRIACASLDPKGTDATRVLELTGSDPTLLHGANSWVLMYRDGESGHVKTRVQRFDAQFRPLGSAKVIPGVQGSLGAQAALTARAGGFVLVAGEPATVYTLDSELEQRGEPIALGERTWSHVAVAATASRIVVSIAQPYSATIFHIDGQGAIKRTIVEGATKNGLPVDLRAQGSSIHATWFDHEEHHALVDATFSPTYSPGPRGHLRVLTLPIRNNLLAAFPAIDGLQVQRIPTVETAE